MTNIGGFPPRNTHTEGMQALIWGQKRIRDIRASNTRVLQITDIYQAHFLYSSGLNSFFFGSILSNFS